MIDKRITSIKPFKQLRLRTKGCYKLQQSNWYVYRFLGDLDNFPFKKQKQTQYSFRKEYLLNKIKEIVKS